VIPYVSCMISRIRKEKEEKRIKWRRQQKMKHRETRDEAEYWNLQEVYEAHRGCKEDGPW